MTLIMMIKINNCVYVGPNGYKAYYRPTVHIGPNGYKAYYTVHIGPNGYKAYNTVQSVIQFYYNHVYRFYYQCLMCKII